jgi:hypothetical protein
MRKSRLISHLKAFSTADWKKFVLMAESPYFNQNQRVLALIRYLHECAPDFSQEQVSKEAIFTILYPKGDKTFSIQIVHDHFSLALRLLESFLVQRALHSEPEINDHLMLRSLSRLGLKKAFQKNYSQLYHEGIPTREPSSFFYRFQTHVEAHTLAQIVRDKTSLGLIDKAEATLDNHFVVNKLKLSVMRVNLQQVFGVRASEAESDNILLDENAVNIRLDDPLIAVYSGISDLLKQPQGTERYDTLVGLLQNVGEQFTRRELTETYAFALNYAIQRFNRGEIAFISRIFELYKRLLELELLTDEDGHFPHAFLKNIVTAGLRNKAFEWTARFIEEYTEKVQPERRSDVYAYNMAMYHFEKQNYREALRGLSMAKFKDVFYELGARTLQVKIYYEMEEDDSIGYLLRAFSAPLRRNKAVSKSYFKLFDNFLRFVNRLYKLKMNAGRTKQESWLAGWDKLSNQLNSQEEGIANAMWLREKLEQLKA